jgi:hypothetical protein
MLLTPALRKDFSLVRLLGLRRLLLRSSVLGFQPRFHLLHLIALILRTIIVLRLFQNLRFLLSSSGGV